jgi:hypothetical protein
MGTYAQILAVVGLVLEFVSVAFTVKKVFWDIHEHLKRISGKATSKYQMTDKPIDGRIIIVFLSVAMFLQGLALFT